MLQVVPPILKLGLFDLRDQGTFAIVDLSKYLVLPDAGHLALQITPPGYEMVNVSFTPGNINIYKCEDLNIICAPLECCSLPDGIYDVRYTVYDIDMAELAKIEKTFIKVNQINCKYENVFAKVDLDCNCGTDTQKQYKHELEKIDMMINGCVAAANDCDVLTAYRLYKKADDMLDNICCAFGMSCTSTFSCPQCQ